MSSSNASTFDQNESRGRKKNSGCWGSRGNWSGWNIAAMVLGFVIFWPIGLFILYWIITGRNVRDLPEGVQEMWNKVTGGWGAESSLSRNDNSDNVVFNEYQQTQHDRIREIQEEIKERSSRFEKFRESAKRRADEEEFNRFMNEAPAQHNH